MTNNQKGEGIKIENINSHPTIDLKAGRSFKE